MGSLKTVDDVCAFYTRVLVSVGLIVNPDGGVYVRAANQELPLPVAGKSLVLPTAENLRSGFNDRQAFAPLGESINLTESIVLKKLRQTITVRQTTVIGALMAELMTIAADVNLHKTLSPTQAELLSVIPEVDEKTVKAVGVVFDTIDPLGDKRLISTYLKRNGIVDGVEYMRAAIVAIDIMRAQVEKEATIYGKAVRVKDKKAFFSLLEFILPGCKDPGKFYSAGSKDKIAPNFHALMVSHLNVMEALNLVIDLFRDKLGNPETLYTPDLSVLRDELEDLKQFNGLIPALSGNMGDGEVSASPAVDPASAPATVAPRATIGQSTAAPAAAQVVTANAAAPLTYAQQQAQRTAEYYAANPMAAPQPPSVRQQYEQQRMYGNAIAAPVPMPTIGQRAGAVPGYVGYQQATHASYQTAPVTNYAPVVAATAPYVRSY